MIPPKFAAPSTHDAPADPISPVAGSTAIIEKVS
jgi:hypothetical protein